MPFGLGDGGRAFENLHRPDRQGAATSPSRTATAVARPQWHQEPLGWAWRSRCVGAASAATVRVHVRSWKGWLARAARDEMRNDVVLVDPDELREFHPQVNGFRNAHPYTWSGLTHPRDPLVKMQRERILLSDLPCLIWVECLICMLTLSGMGVPYE
ncbi:zeta toxin family protein [Pantoea ananatis]|uniref:zeta toxin family protein n=1 Tax=Pantoea ananas TaxID=553 RepID=UPI002220164C|nr:zeta toxin family protein [Pantoea ananatis]